MCTGWARQQGQGKESDNHADRSLAGIVRTGGIGPRHREIHPHYLLVGQQGEHSHKDLEVPVHVIRGFTEGYLQASVNRGAVTEVDDVETAHRMGEE